MSMSAVAVAQRRRLSIMAVGVAFLAIILAFVPIDSSELCLGFIGAVVYMLLQLRKPKKREAKKAPRGGSTISEPACTSQQRSDDTDDDASLVGGLGYLAPSTANDPHDSALDTQAIVSEHVDQRSAAMLVHKSTDHFSRALEFISLVERWATDSGLSQASSLQRKNQEADGRLSPYAWNILAVYFLQIGMGEEGGVIPAFNSPEFSSPLLPRACKLCVNVLFRNFIHFYSSRFDWQNESANLGLGYRAPPAKSLPRRVAVDDDGFAMELCPMIEDPFSAGRNLGDHMTAAAISRLQEEFMHAEFMCSSGALAADLLKPRQPGLHDHPHSTTLTSSASALQVSEPEDSDSQSDADQAEGESDADVHPSWLTHRNFMMLWLLMPQSGLL